MCRGTGAEWTSSSKLVVDRATTILGWNKVYPTFPRDIELQADGPGSQRRDRTKGLKVGVKRVARCAANKDEDRTPSEEDVGGAAAIRRTTMDDEK